MAFDPRNFKQLQDIYGQMQGMIASGDEAGAKALYKTKQSELGFTNDDFSVYGSQGAFDKNQLASWSGVANPVNTSITATPKTTATNAWDAKVYQNALSDPTVSAQLARLQTAKDYWDNSANPRAKEASDFYQNAINFGARMGDGGFDQNRLVDYVNKSLSGAWTDMAAKDAGYGDSLSYGVIGSNQDTRDLANLYANNFSRESIQNEMARQYGAPSIVENAGTGQTGTAGSPYFEIRAADGSILRTAPTKEAAEAMAQQMGLSSAAVQGGRNYDLNALNTWGAEPNSYTSWVNSGYAKTDPVYGDPSYGGQGGFSSNQGPLADPKNMSPEAIAYRQWASKLNLPKYEGSGGVNVQRIGGTISGSGGYSSGSSSANLGMGGGYSPSPYLDQMAKSITQQANDNWTRTVDPTIRSNAVSAGGYGGSRQGVVEANALKDINTGLSSALSNMYNTDYQNQQNRNLSKYQSDQSYSLGLGNLGLGYTNAANNYDLGLRSNDLGYANLDANIYQNNFNNQLASANFGMGVYNALNGQTQAGINAGTNIQNTPLDYQKYFTNSANGVGSGYGTSTSSGTAQGNPYLGFLGGASIGSAVANPYLNQYSNTALVSGIK